MVSEQIQRTLARLWTNYNEALRLYAEHRQGQRESIEAIAKDPARPTRHERAMGQIRWGDTATARGIVDDWKIAEGRVALSANAATVDLLLAIRTQLEDMNRNLHELILRNEIRHP